MKILLSVLFLIAGINLGFCQNAIDPFAATAPQMLDRSKDKKSDSFLDAKMLENLGERRLDGGSGIKDEAIIRVTVIRSFHAPLVLSWQLTKNQSWLQVKRGKKMVTEAGVTTYQALDIDKRIDLTPAQQATLKRIWKEVNYNVLPQDCWKGPAMDGSTWIFEIASDEGSTVLLRTNPIITPAEADGLSKERLVEEMHLTTFALVLWTMAGIDDADIY